MRQRKAKDLEARLAKCSRYIVDRSRCEDPGGAPAQWPYRRIFAEIGCGKGQFIIRKAIDDPESGFIGIEGQETVILRAAEKAMAVSGEMDWPENVPGRERLCTAGGKLDNLRFMNCFVDRMEDMFGESSLAGIYLNFSDPWPKAKHAKRRLTYGSRLVDYAWALSPGGFIDIRTDNDDLFEFTLEQIADAGDLLRIEMLTRDLHGDEGAFEAARITTEYEDRFVGRGKNINYVRVIVNKER